MTRFFLEKCLRDLKAIDKFTERFASYIENSLWKRKSYKIVQDILKEGLETLLNFFIAVFGKINLK